MSTPGEADTVEMAAKPSGGSDQSPRRSSVAAVDMAGLTDRGHRRPNNEDHFLISRFGRFLETLDTNLSPEDAPFREEETGYSLLVADGMGGHAGGEVASKLAISTLINLALATPDWILRLDDDPLMQEVMRRAKERWGLINTALTDHAEADPECEGTGYDPDPRLEPRQKSDGRSHWRFSCLSVPQKTTPPSDSRSYVCAISGGSGNHRPVRGCQASHAQRADQSARKREQAVEPDLLNLTLEDGDVLLLCTDGLTDMVEESLIQSTLDGEEDSKTICRRLVEQALEAGGKDNVTVAVAHYRFN